MSGFYIAVKTDITTGIYDRLKKLLPSHIPVL